MTQAFITINVVVGSDDDLLINTVVQLDNTNNGGEVSYLWTILDQPEGTVDALSSATIQNLVFTPNKEGTYLIRLVVNQSLASEQTNQVVASVRHLKTRNRIPAAGETTENDASDGWSKPNGVDALLKKIVDVQADSGYYVGLAGGVLVPGDIVRPVGDGTIKTGLPGEERLVYVGGTDATTLDVLTDPLFVVINAVDGGGIVLNSIVRLRAFGLVENIPIVGVVAGDTIYVSDTGVPDRVPGTNTRTIGRATSVPSAGVAHIFFYGLGGG